MSNGRDDTRRYERFPVAWAVELTATEWQDVLQLTTGNVSRGGVFVRSAQPVDVGARIRVRLKLPDGGTLDAEGEIVHTLSAARAPDYDTEPGFGIKFDEKHAIDLSLLESMAASHAGGPHSYKVDEDYITLPAVVMDLAHGTTQMTSAHRPISQIEGDRDPSLRSAVADAAGAVEIEIEIDDLDARDSAPRDRQATPTNSGLGRATSPIASRNEAVTVEGMDPAQPGTANNLAVRPTDDGAGGLAGSRANRPTQESVPAAAKSAPSDAKPTGGLAAVRPPAAAPTRARIFGIDFGTSYCSIGVVDGDQVKLLPDADGQTLLPSVVHYPKQGAPVVGWAARRQMVLDPRNTISSPKRLIGRRHDDRTIEPWLAQLGLPTRPGPNAQVLVELRGQPLSMPQVVAELFRAMAELGERATGEPVRQVLISAPVAHSDIQRDALKRAAKLAHLELVALLDEPFSATVAYGVAGAEGETVAVYDFGGGTFDFTIARIENRRFRVLARAGDAWLGGDDFDLVLAEHAANAFERQYKIDLRRRQVEWQQLVFLSERVKRRLSVEQTAPMFAKGFLRTVKGAADLNVPFDRDLLAELCGPLVDRSLDVVGPCMELAGISADQVNQVIVTGGVSRMPLVRSRLEQHFKREIRMAVSPDHAIVLGNAVYGAYVAAATSRRGG